MTIRDCGAHLLAMHELAQENFRANLSGPTGETARAYLANADVARETIEQFGLGLLRSVRARAAAAVRAAQLSGRADRAIGAGGQAR